MSNSIHQSKADTKGQNQVELLPAVANYLQVLNEQVLPAFINTGSVPNAINARDGLAHLTHTFVTETVDVALIVDDIIECDASADDVYDVPAYNVPVRLFYPSEPDNVNQTEPTVLPVMLYFHGGGGTAGSVSVYHQILCRLAKHTGHIVVAPEYRLAPENPYPCGQNDACTALLGLPALLARHHISTNKLVVAGDSHGGALVTNLLRDPRIIKSGTINDISAQVLIYPSVDFTMSCPSIETYANGYLLSQARISWYFDQYFQHGEDRQAKSALFASQNELAQQPPALIINAAVDPLYDEGAAYATKLSEAGVDTQHMTYDKVIHAYLNMESLNPDICQQTYQAINAFLASKSSE
ncbi:alpha/beta hydrolase [Psychrobacter sp. FBL11]|uniref:Alpha/beta hydrolase n=1 Tax=Psychrobacter saeujeotis TaxID=3143436 RepID=A0ABU9X8G0_9GAMM|nr:alpha/beta hydrolase [uncultured Psychrobacter sp.]